MLCQPCKALQQANAEQLDWQSTQGLQQVGSTGTHEILGYLAIMSRSSAACTCSLIITLSCLRSRLLGVQKVVDMGIVDRARVAVGGHSYGAFMTANLLAHAGVRPLACRSHTQI